MRFQERYDNFLMHYGVPGMKWGVRKSKSLWQKKKKRKKVSRREQRKRDEFKQARINALTKEIDRISKMSVLEYAIEQALYSAKLAGDDPLDEKEARKYVKSNLNDFKELQKEELDNMNKEVAALRKAPYYNALQAYY